MENETFRINMGDKDKAEVIIRRVGGVNELPVKPAIPINLEGTLRSPYEFLVKRSDQPDQINQKRCLILIDREAMSITLVTHEDDPYHQGKVVGVLEVHPKLKAFGINTGKQWDPNELGQFFKMNRAYFLDKSVNMDLVTRLKSFEATVNSKIEKKKTESGDFADSFSGVVNSNLPPNFKLNIPLFKGDNPEEFEVEFYATVNGRTVTLQLISPGAQETMDQVKDDAIDTQIELIDNLTPNIVIIET